MKVIDKTKRLFLVSTLIVGLGVFTNVFGAATIVINNLNGPGVGFNDPTSVLPVGGNPGTTLGQQRLNAFQHAANIWGATLDSTVTITVNAQMTALTCTATSAVLGSAGSVTAHRDFAGAPFTGTWFGSSLANKLNGIDIGGAASNDINANFNVNLGQVGCLTGTFYYLGLDNNHGTNIDLVTVLLHEFAHGLGFQTFTSASTGIVLSSFPTIYDRFLLDTTSGKSWLNMTNAERVASAINSRKLVWTGPQVQADLPSALSLGVPFLRINTPAGIAGNFEVGQATFGPVLTPGGLTGDLVLAVDGTAPAGDGCEPLTNAAQVSGKIAVIDRGLCGFPVKVLNAQNAGAIGVVIADNVAGSPALGMGGSDPSITIPAVRVTLSDGNIIKAQLGGTVNGTMFADNTIRLGADRFGKAQLFTPNPFQGGSSVAHWDTLATFNQLMEPSINVNLTHQVTPPTDLTFSLLRDIGWTPSSLPAAVAVSGGNNQSAIINQPFGSPLSVTVTPAIAGLTVTFTAPTTGASGTFADSGSFQGDNLLILNSRVTTAVTNAAGVATTPVFTANGTGGTYTINTTVAGAGTTGVQLTNSVPTAANVAIGGRVLSADGRALSRVSVRLTQPNGVVRTAYTNTFGYYTISDLNAGELVIVNARAKGHQFASQLVTLFDGVTNLDLIAAP